MVNTWRIACPDVWAPQIREIIEHAVPEGFSIEFAGVNGAGSPDDVIGQADFILLGATKMTAGRIGGARNLRLIQRWGIGYDNVDLQAAEQEGVGVAITAGANAHAVAEHTIMLMLGTMRHLPRADHAMREGHWLNKELRVESRQLLGKAIGLIGFGNIGRAVAKRLLGFDVSVIYYDPRRAPPEVEEALKARFVPRDELLAEADVVSLHCPGGEENRHMIDPAALARMKPGAILINAARGELVQQDGLAEALASGRLRGAGLDVFEREPVEAGNPLLTFDSVVLTPHTAASVLDNVGRMVRHIIGNMQRVAAGEPLVEADVIVAPRKRAAVA